MKKLLFIITFYSYFGYSQADFTKIYHPIINEAELAIVDTNYHDALDFYNEAFANVQKPFAKDYYNAAICAAMVGKMPQVFDYLERIVEKGYPADSLRKDRFFKHVADTCKRWSTFEKQAKLIKHTFNFELKDSLKILSTLSQSQYFSPLTPELRKYYKENFLDKNKDKTRSFIYSTPGDSLIWAKNMPKDLLAQHDSIRSLNYSKNQAVYKQVLIKTIQLIDYYGFPDENEIGLTDYQNVMSYSYSNNSYQNTIRNLSKPPFESTQVSSLLSLIDYMKGSEKIDIFTPIKKAIKDGKLHPYIARNLMNSSDNTYSQMGNVHVFQLRLEDKVICENLTWNEKKDKWFWKKEQPKYYNEDEINERRVDMGFEKLNDAYRKAFFKAIPTPFIIKGGNYQRELSYASSCEILENLMKGAVAVK